MSEIDTSPAKLVILTGADKGKELLLKAHDAVIGRTDEADLVVPDRSISRRHAGITLRDGVWFVRDLDSKNGLRVNNRDVTEQGLRTGDMIMIGSVKLKFVDPRDLEPPPLQQQAEQPPLEPAQLPAELAPAQIDPRGLPRSAPQAPQQAPAPAGQAPGFYSPKPQVQADLSAPPPEFYAPAQPVQQTSRPRMPLTRRKAMAYVAALAALGLGLGYLLWVTFGPKEKPFREDVKLSVGDVQLVDLVRRYAPLRSSTCLVGETRIASVAYDEGMALLRVEGRALGHTEVTFTGQRKRLFGGVSKRTLGTVGVHVLAGARRKYVDRLALSDDQRKLRARELIAEGDALGKAHIPDAIAKYDMANYLLENIEDQALVAMARVRLTDMSAERDDRFRRLKDRYRQANQLKDYRTAKEHLDEICKLFPDPSDEENQRAKIFLMRLQAAERSQQKKKT